MNIDVLVCWIFYSGHTWGPLESVEGSDDVAYLRKRCLRCGTTQKRLDVWETLRRLKLKLRPEGKR